MKEQPMKAFNLLAAGLIAVSAGAEAQTTPPATQASSASASASMTDGEVRKVDKDAGKLTLRHGPIRNLEMPGMTMVFKVADPNMLDTLKQGDKVRFAAERVDGAITVTKIEATK
jgi:Cu(I)/Ag(I) efflux system periplasmic protein CusF